jgi:hypothetical protein
VKRVAVALLLVSAMGLFADRAAAFGRRNRPARCGPPVYYCQPVPHNCQPTCCTPIILNCVPSNSSEEENDPDFPTPLAKVPEIPDIPSEADDAEPPPLRLFGGADEKK